jgi:hypothetical protein
MKQFEDCPTDSHEIWYRGVLLTFVDKFPFWIKSYSDNEHFTRKPVCVSGRRSDWVGILQYTLVIMVAMVNLLDGQRLNVGEIVRIVTLCVYFQTCPHILLSLLDLHSSQTENTTPDPEQESLGVFSFKSKQTLKLQNRLWCVHGTPSKTCRV